MGIHQISSSNTQKTKSKKVALITGASRDPALALSRALASQGWWLGLNDLNPTALDEITRHINDAGGQARAHVADISQKLALQTILNEVEDEWGYIDLLINNTRVMPAKPLLDMDEWDWRRTIDINLTGAFLLTQVVGRMMHARGDGIIVHLIHPHDEVGYASYTATQSGVEGLVRIANQELEKFGVQVYAFLLNTLGEEELIQQILQLKT